MSSRRHISALINIFEFASASDLSWEAGAKQAAESEERVVRGFIARGVPCGVGEKVADLFLHTQPWSQRVDFESLWRAYDAGGYIAPNAPLHDMWRSELVQMLPVEAAILRRHTDALKALIASGADLGAVPSRPWRVSTRSRKCREAENVKDIFAFVKFAVPKAQVALRQEMEALVTKALMLRRIDERPAPAPAATADAAAHPTPASIAASLASARRRRRAV